jgi:hypothetical protein
MLFLPHLFQVHTVKLDFLKALIDGLFHSRGGVNDIWIFCVWIIWRFWVGYMLAMDMEVL